MVNTQTSLYYSLCFFLCIQYTIIILLMFLEARVGLEARNWRQLEVLLLRGPGKLETQLEGLWGQKFVFRWEWSEDVCVLQGTVVQGLMVQRREEGANVTNT